MLEKYEYIDHTADLGFKAWGTTKEALFVHAAEALFGIMASVEAIEPEREKVVEVHASALDDLLVSWLNELVFLFDAEGLLPGQFVIEDMKDDSLRARVWGEPVDPDRHGIKTGVKAATYHKLYVEKRDGLWECRVFLDL